MLGLPILYFKGTRLMMFQLSGFYCRSLAGQGSGPNFRVCDDRKRVEGLRGRLAHHMLFFSVVEPLPERGSQIFLSPAGRLCWVITKNIVVTELESVRGSWMLSTIFWEYSLARKDHVLLGRMVA